MLIDHYCRRSMIAEFGEQIARYVHKLRKHIRDHKERVEMHGIVWAPAPSSADLSNGEKHIINDSLSQCAILRKQVGARVFYALSRRSAMHYKSESLCTENNY